MGLRPNVSHYCPQTRVRIGGVVFSFIPVASKSLAHKKRKEKKQATQKVVPSFPPFLSPSTFFNPFLEFEVKATSNGW
jgi:hypothetical protein